MVLVSCVTFITSLLIRFFISLYDTFNLIILIILS
jgi:hypothetical protein